MDVLEISKYFIFEEVYMLFDIWYYVFWSVFWVVDFLDNYMMELL